MLVDRVNLKPPLEHDIELIKITGILIVKEKGPIILKYRVERGAKQEVY